MTEVRTNDPWHESPAETAAAEAAPAPPRRPEPIELPVRAVGVTVACFVAFGIVMFAGLWYFVRGAAEERIVDRATSAVPDYGVVTREPALQPSAGHERTPREDLEAMRRGEDRVFAAMGWAVDERRHRAAVPVDVVRDVAAAREPGAGTGKAEGGRRKAGEAGGSAATRRVVTPVPGVDQGGGR